MDDPDMGYWAYTYDALGNLLTQTDARGCTTSLTYDLINRLENKSYSGSCGVSTAAVTYTYDQGANGVGQRTRMDYGSGSYTTWSYDARGRVEYETQVISGSGTFLTQYAYNSADLPVWMRYPANNASGQGEMVNYTYNTQMLLDRVYGTRHLRGRHLVRRCRAGHAARAGHQLHPGADLRLLPLDAAGRTLTEPAERDSRRSRFAAIIELQLRCSGQCGNDFRLRCHKQPQRSAGADVRL